jgi:hypothetical protein
MPLPAGSPQRAGQGTHKGHTGISPYRSVLFLLRHVCGTQAPSSSGLRRASNAWRRNSVKLVEEQYPVVPQCSSMYSKAVNLDVLRSLLSGSSCGKEEQRALHRLEAQNDHGLPHPPEDRCQDRGDDVKPDDDEQTDEHSRCQGCPASAQEQQADEDGDRSGEQGEEVRHLYAERELIPQQQRDHAGPIVQRQHEDGDVHDKRAHRERHRRDRGDPACPMTNFHERSVDVGKEAVEAIRPLLPERSTPLQPPAAVRLPVSPGSVKHI